LKLAVTTNHVAVRRYTFVIEHRRETPVREDVSRRCHDPILPPLWTDNQVSNIDRPRGPLAATGALGLAVLAASVIAIWTSVSHARAFQAMAPVNMTIRINGTENVFAPPPHGVTPAKTARQAWPAFFAPHGAAKNSPGSTVQLGLLTSPVGPYCGVSCDMWTVKNGIAYRVLNRLVYGYSWLAFPHRNSHARDWWFVDANTGEMLFGVGARPPGGSY